MTAVLAFYKGKGDWIDRVIRMVSRSVYSHVEFVPDYHADIPGDVKRQECWSSSPRDGGVRKANINLASGNWVVVPVYWTTHNAKLFFAMKKGAKYDLVGVIFSQFFALRRQQTDRWFCSEICAAALNLNAPETYSPATLKQAVHTLNMVHNDAFEKGWNAREMSNV